MTRHSRRRAGFTLTEILMAVGILGVGMTMVASVFPVAVDQSRRSRDATLAALSARSVAAVLRAQREQIISWCRTHANVGTANMSGWTASASDNVPEAIPDSLRVYRPNAFLYDLGRFNDVTTTGYAPWRQGDYMPVLFATPIKATPNSPNYGPWRITIVMYKARGGYGRDPFDTPSGTTERAVLRKPLNLYSREVYQAESVGQRYTQTYLKAWSWLLPAALDPTGRSVFEDNYPCRGDVGDYVMDAPPIGSTPQDNNRGDAYLVEKVFRPQTLAGQLPNAANDRIVLAGMAFTLETALPGRPQDCQARDRTVKAGFDAGGAGVDPIPGWVSLPHALVAYQTVIGD